MPPTSRIAMLNIQMEREKALAVLKSTADALTVEVIAEYVRCLDDALAECQSDRPVGLIDGIMAVPGDIEAAIRDWYLVAHIDYRGADWLAIGAAIENHVAEKVADALRLERGGCTYCPAEKDGPHKMDCRRPSGGVIVARGPVEFKP